MSQNDASLPTATTTQTIGGRLAIDRLKQRLEPQLEQRRCMRTSDAPYRAMLSWQQMASFGVYQEGLDDLPQQRGTRESLLPCVVQSRACAHNITGAGGKSLSPSGPPRTPRPAHAPPAWSNKMASFSVGQCVVLQFTPDPWSVRITIAWCTCTPPWSTKTCRGKFRV